MELKDLLDRNPWWKNRDDIYNDINIKKFNEAIIKWYPRLKHYIKFDRDKIYTLRGPRQVGKTTLCKILIKELIESGVAPQSIFYYSCDLVENGNELKILFELYLEWIKPFSFPRKYIFIDEISSVKNWELGIKSLADTGKLLDSTIILTGSHSIDIKNSIELLPGRRGDGNETLNKMLLPMKFSEFVETVNPSIKEFLQRENLNHRHKREEILFKVFNEKKIDPCLKNLILYQKDLDNLFDIYLKTGGIPKPINEFYSSGLIPNGIYEMYVKSLMGDLSRWRVPEIPIKKLIELIFQRLTTNVSWNTLSEETDIKSHNTVSKYVGYLDDSFVLNVLYAMDLSKRTPNTKREKKIYPQDPFIFHALNSWVRGVYDFYSNSEEYLSSSENKSKLVESVVHSHLVKLMYNLFQSDVYSPSSNLFYLKTKRGEIDFVLNTHGNQMYPIELKYQSQISKQDYYNLLKYKNGFLLSKNKIDFDSEVVTIPVSIFLLLI